MNTIKMNLIRPISELIIWYYKTDAIEKRYDISDDTCNIKFDPEVEGDNVVMLMLAFVSLQDSVSSSTRGSDLG